MNILLYGANGRVGWELQRSLQTLGTVVALDRRRDGAFDGDVTHHDSMAETIRRVRPGVIVNAAAYTAVDRAEIEPDAAHAVNAVAPAALAREAKAIGAWLVHFSTDYVYDGSGDEPYTEASPTEPISVYGRSKLAGDEQIQATAGNHLILRPSWIYCARRPSFATTMLDLAAERPSVKTVDDHVGAPTGADLVADVTAHALRTVLQRPTQAAEYSGVYHLAAAGSTDWHRYAQMVFAWGRAHGLPINLDPNGVVPVASHEFARAAKRPLNSRLCTRKLCDTFELVMPDWQSGVERMLQERYGHAIAQQEKRESP
jgi:dTDP-4-dehydrorhamnose reductase